MSAEIKFANYCTKTIADAGGISAVATSVTLNSVTGLPTIAAGDWFYLVLVRLADLAVEVVKVTAVVTATKVCTITRAQEGTTGLVFALGDRAELWMTAGTLSDLRTQWQNDIKAATATGALTRGSIWVGGAGNVATELAGGVAGHILVSDGTDIKSVAVNTDATLAANGALTIADNAITTAKILAKNVTVAKMEDLTSGKIWVGSSGDRPVACTLTGSIAVSNTGVVTLTGTDIPVLAEVTIASADVKKLFSVPYTLVAAPGAGKVIVYHGGVIVMDYDTAAYTIASGAVKICYENYAGGNASDRDLTSAITATSDYASTVAPSYLTGELEYRNAGTAVDRRNKALVLAAQAADPAAGSGVVRVKVWYSIVDLAL